MKQNNQSQTKGSSSGRSTRQASEVDFDTWAVEVRQQMIAALKRRGSA